MLHQHSCGLVWSRLLLINCWINVVHEVRGWDTSPKDNSAEWDTSPKDNSAESA